MAKRQLVPGQLASTREQDIQHMYNPYAQFRLMVTSLKSSLPHEQITQFISIAQDSGVMIADQASSHQVWFWLLLKMLELLTAVVVVVPLDLIELRDFQNPRLDQQKSILMSMKSSTFAHVTGACNERWFDRLKKIWLDTAGLHFQLWGYENNYL